MIEKPGAPHALPIGAVVEYRAPDLGGGINDTYDRARLVVVQHSRDCDGTPLYMVAKRAIAPPPEEHKVYSRPYLIYRLHAGWFAGNVGCSCLSDTGQRVGVERFKVEPWMS